MSNSLNKAGGRYFCSLHLININELIMPIQWQIYITSAVSPEIEIYM